MPDGGRTGRMGQGPLTGRGAGFCRGNDLPGYANRGREAGRGRGKGRTLRISPTAPDHPTNTRERLRQRAEVFRAELQRVNRQLTNLAPDQGDA